MNVKTDTKEKFHAITVIDPVLSATMTDEIGECLLPYLEKEASLPGRQVKNLVLILKNVKELDTVAAEKLVYIQQKFYETSASFVICELQKQVEEFLDNNGLLELMNVTPTESEAWDIVQMEEIEREMMDEEGF
ncbi:MAG: STAS domain-containing protein [Sphingobacteriales bacterium]|nr:STAS domain-containing protein [Sphingobacteriales bacterium]